MSLRFSGASPYPTRPETVRNYGRCAEMSETTEIERAEQLHEEAFELYRQGELDSALATVEQSLIEDLTWSTSHATHALILAARGEDRAAERAANAALRIEPKYAYAHFAQGVVLFEGQDYQRAAGAFETAMRLDGQSGDAMVQLGLCQWQLGDKVSALQNFERAAALSEDDPRPFQYIGALALDSGDPEQALESIAKAIAIDDDNPELVAQKAEALWDLERHDEVRELLGAWAASHTDQVWVRDMASRCALQIGETEESRKWLTEALALEPDSPDLQLLDAVISATTGASEEAIEKLGTILDQDPENLEALNYLAALQQDLGDYTNSIATCARILEQNASDLNALLTLSRCHLAEGRRQEAQKQVELALEHHPDDTTAQELERAIKLSEGLFSRFLASDLTIPVYGTCAVLATAAIYLALRGNNPAIAGLCAVAASAVALWYHLRNR